MLPILPPQAPVVEVPKSSWIHDLYGSPKEVTTILGRASLNGYADLRKHLLPVGDEEVRIWAGFGVTYLQAIILRRQNGRWSAVSLLSAPPKTPKDKLSQTLGAPKSGWPAFWQRAEALGIWTLPDDSTLPQENVQMVLDGLSYVVEIQRNGRYRAYTYNNPDYQKQWPEAKQMAALGKLLGREFPYQPNKDR